MRIAIDGACRRNGKPDCVSAGGVVIQEPESFLLLGKHEHESTNQRGELQALLLALKYLSEHDEEALIITDSEYLFNAMTKNWYDRWGANGWVTASGEPVKNRDLWEQIATISNRIETPPIYYHIKGHCISIGKVTASMLLNADLHGNVLYEALCAKFDKDKPTKEAAFCNAQELSEKNNGFKLDKDTFKEFVVLNTMADILATEEVEIADREI